MQYVGFICCSLRLEFENCHFQVKRGHQSEEKWAPLKTAPLLTVPYELCGSTGSRHTHMGQHHPWHFLPLPRAALESMCHPVHRSCQQQGAECGWLPLSMKGKISGLAPHGLILWWDSFRDCLPGFSEASGCPYQSPWLAAFPMTADCLFSSTSEKQSCFLARKSSCCLDDWNVCLEWTVSMDGMWKGCHGKILLGLADATLNRGFLA